MPASAGKNKRLSWKETSFSLPLSDDYDILISNYKDTTISSEGHLRPYESYVLYRRKD